MVCPFRDHAGAMSCLTCVCRPFVHAMLTLTVSKQPLLELRGARGLGRIAFKAPFYCPNANRTLLDTKAEIAQAGGVPALIGMLLPRPHVLMPGLNSTAMLPALVYKAVQRNMSSSK